MNTAGHIFTIGHSTHSPERFLDLLHQHGIQAIADVRSTPFSRFNPHFNREVLADLLRQNDVQYVFLGRELGARSDDASCYENGQVQYGRLAKTALFLSGLERVMKGACTHRIALMCTEREPLECHRTLMVARELVARSVPVMHILGDGRLESHAEAMLRLQDLTGVPRSDFFRPLEDLQSEAITRQEKKVAYVLPSTAGSVVKEDAP